jgi:hypothetical protein
MIGHASRAIPPTMANAPPSPPVEELNGHAARFNAGWINVCFGLLVFVLRYGSPRPTFSVHWNLFLTGIVIMFAAFATTIAHDGNSSKNYWSAINIAAGVWLLVSAKTIPSILPVTLAQEVLGVMVIAAALVSLANEFAFQRLSAKRIDGHSRYR